MQKIGRKDAQKVPKETGRVQPAQPNSTTVKRKDAQKVPKERGPVQPVQPNSTTVKAPNVASSSPVSTPLRPNVVTITINKAAPTSVQKTNGKCLGFGCLCV